MRLALDRTAAKVRPGITTAELDCIGARVLADHDAESAPPKVYAFPGALRISVNDVAIHGPGGRVIQAGDPLPEKCRRWAKVKSTSTGNSV